MSNYFNKVVMGVLTLLLPFVSLLFVACSEEDDTQEEYPNWQETNETYFNKLYAEANKRIAAGDKSWKVIPKWSLQDTLHLNADDYIIAHVVSEGSGTETPIFSDTVLVHYQGRLLPSTSYPAGRVFDQTWLNEYNPKTMTPSKMGVSQTVKAVTQNGQTTYQTSSNIDGFTTALMQMHEGDRWMVYIPYSLAYGTEATDNIPAYSTLVFDLTLAAFYHTGQVVPRF